MPKNAILFYNNAILAVECKSAYKILGPDHLHHFSLQAGCGMVQEKLPLFAESVRAWLQPSMGRTLQPQDATKATAPYAGYKVSASWIQRWPTPG